MCPGERCATVVVVGLGNAGLLPRLSRHSVGQLVVDRWAQRAGVDWHESRVCRGRVAELQLDAPATARNASLASVQAPPVSVRVALLKPASAMNLSGGAIAATARHYRAQATEHIVLCHDDAQRAFGKCGWREPGRSTGGHNGLRSAAAALGTLQFGRLWVGIGRGTSTPGANDLADHVLASFSADEAAALNADLLDRCVDLLVSHVVRIGSLESANAR